MKRRVDPKLYDKKYYLEGCSGYNEFKESNGEKLEPRFKEISKLYPDFKNKKVLDVGTGRGEMVQYALKKGAKEAIGIDYSKDAISLSKKAFKKGKFFVRDAKKTKFKDKSFDIILLIEVLEHLYPEEQIEIFEELNRILKDDGVIFVHTAPSKTFNNFTYRYWCYPVSTFVTSLWNMIFDKKYTNIAKPEKIRNEYEKEMHVAEPDFFSIRKLIEKTGFKGEIKSTNVTIRKPFISFKDAIFNFLVYLYPLSNHFPFNIFWGNDFYVKLKKL